VILSRLPLGIFVSDKIIFKKKEKQEIGLKQKLPGDMMWDIKESTLCSRYILLQQFQVQSRFLY